MKIETNIPKTITRTLTFSSGKTVQLTEDEFLEIQNYFYREGMRPAVPNDPFWEYFYKKDPFDINKVTMNSFGTLQQNPRDIHKAMY